MTSFYAGFSDDLTLYDYRDALRSVFGSKFPARDLDDAARFRRFLLEVASKRKPAFFS